MHNLIKKLASGTTEGASGHSLPRRVIVPAGIAGVILALLLPFPGTGCTPEITSADSSQLSDGTEPGRIISAAPSITETVFAVGAGDKLVGVTKFCEYPPRARLLPKVGGLLDPSGEAIVRLEPDLVIVLEENLKFRQELSASDYRVVAVNHKSIPGIIASIESIGRACGREEQGVRLAAGLRHRIEELETRKSLNTPSPRVIISVGRNAGSGSLGKVYIAGKDNYYEEMIRLAGGVNAYSGSIRYPAVSIEGLLRMNPDVIIDLVPGYPEKGLKEESLRGEWNEMRGTRAFETGNIYIRGEDYWTLPGPRFIRIVEDLSLILNQ